MKFIQQFNIFLQLLVRPPTGALTLDSAGGLPSPRTAQLVPFSKVLNLPHRLRCRQNQGGLVHLSAWHLPGGPVGKPARWATTSNVEEGSGAAEGARGP